MNRVFRWFLRVTKLFKVEKSLKKFNEYRSSYYLRQSFLTRFTFLKTIVFLKLQLIENLLKFKIIYYLFPRVAYLSLLLLELLESNLDLIYITHFFSVSYSNNYMHHKKFYNSI